MGNIEYVSSKRSKAVAIIAQITSNRVTFRVPRHGLVFSSEKYQFDENASGVDVVFYYKTHKIIDFFQEARGRGAKPLRSLPDCINLDNCKNH